jgi:hypothetical protein
VRPAELARRAHPEGAVRVHLVIVLEPGGELGHDRGRVRSGVEPSVVALEGLHEGFGDTIMGPEEIDDFISGHDWRFARTMAHIPHSFRRMCMTKRSNSMGLRYTIIINRAVKQP